MDLGSFPSTHLLLLKTFVCCMCLQSTHGYANISEMGLIIAEVTRPNEIFEGREIFVRID